MEKTVKRKYANLGDTKTLTGAGLLIAFAVIIDFFRLVISQNAEINFNFLAMVVAGMAYGPFVGAIVGGVSDILAYMIRPSGPFFPGFTLNSILVGVIWGYSLYKRKPTLVRVTVTYLLVGVITNLILTPIWLKILYGNALFALPRLIRFLALAPIKIALVYFIANFLIKSRIINRLTD